MMSLRITSFCVGMCLLANEGHASAIARLPRQCFVVIDSQRPAEVQQQWRETGFGRAWLSDPMKTFREHVEGDDDSSALWGSFGFEEADMASPVREFCSALIDTGDKSPARVSLVDLEEPTEAEQLAVRIGRRFLEAGATRHVVESGDTSVIAFHKGENVTAMAVRDTTIVCSDHQATVRHILASWDETDDKLVSQAAFRTIAERCEISLATKRPQVVWYAHPLTVVEVRQRQQPRANGEQRARRYGLDQVAGIGGVVRLGGEGFDAWHKMFISVPEPEPGVPQMFRLLNKPANLPPVLPQRWASIFTASWDMPRALRNCGRLFDDYYAEGIDGTFQDVLDDMKSEDGLGIDLEEELKQFKAGCTFVCSLSADGKTNEWAWVAKAGNANRVRQVVNALFDGDPDVKRGTLPTGDEYWEIQGSGSDAGIVFSIVHGHLVIASSVRHLATLSPANDEKLPAKYSALKSALGEAALKTASAHGFIRVKRAFGPDWGSLGEGQDDERS
ncbi:MAG: hypothetical protein ACC645_25310, partial [Pirellulales bacterium]